MRMKPLFLSIYLVPTQSCTIILPIIPDHLIAHSRTPSSQAISGVPSRCEPWNAVPGWHGMEWKSRGSHPTDCSIPPSHPVDPVASVLQIKLSGGAAVNAYDEFYRNVFLDNDNPGMPCLPSLHLTRGTGEDSQSRWLKMVEVAGWLGGNY